MEVAVFLNRTTFYEGVKCVFSFTKKLFRVACDYFNHVPMKVLGSKPLIKHFEYTNGVLDIYYGVCICTPVREIFLDYKVVLY